jgi:MarR family 2-MHQ and catechol resistance regulon transcriptional repressor
VSKYDWYEFRNANHQMVVTAVRVADQLAKACDRFLAPYEITLAQFNVIAILYSYPDGLAQSRLGEQLVVSRANVTGLIDRMKKQGLCRTLDDPEDARIKRVQLTAKARKLMDRIEKPYFEEIRRITRVLNTREMNSVSDALARVSDSL